MPLQTSYAVAPAAGLAGMLADNGSREIVTKIASEAIPFGSIVELNAGKVRRPQGTTSTMALCGVALYQGVKESSLGAATAINYVAGDPVPVLRRGRVFALFTGTTVPADGAVLNVMHSSTTATNRGYVTDAATATTSGAEITATVAGSGLTAYSDPGVSGLCVIEVNLP